VSEPLVSFVVLNWRGEEATRRCVESVLAQPGGAHREVIVVDNESSAESRLRLGDGPWRLVPLEGNRGFTGGMNAGAAAARGEYVALLNNDLQLPPEWLELALAAMDDPRVGIVGGRAEDGYTLSRIDPERGFSQMLKVEAPRAHVATVNGSHLFVRRAAFEQLGGFDDDFFAYIEEDDLCARALAAGWRVLYEPALRVLHERGLSSDRVPIRRAYWAKRNRLVFIAKHFPDSSWRRLARGAAAEYMSDALVGRSGGLRGARGRPRLPAGERLGSLLAALWWATHGWRLRRKRRLAIEAGQHDEGYAGFVRELYWPPPLGPALRA
jgi:GT2 family glycosyltransferase